MGQKELRKHAREALQDLEVEAARINVRQGHLAFWKNLVFVVARPVAIAWEHREEIVAFLKSFHR